ncbi:hypothetical protein F5883DRAFT_202625 [Diaporthe sp. PMI_573]|nr:hypothetical protein F5883DRAFT_202625 [Diaporthaceae sp. PMI_573]
MKCSRKGNANSQTRSFGILISLVFLTQRKVRGCHLGSPRAPLASGKEQWRFVSKEMTTSAASLKAGENDDQGGYGQMAGIYVGVEIPHLP